MMEAETGVMHPQAKECQELSATLEARKRQRMILPQSLQGAGIWPCQHLDFRFLASRTVRKQVSVVLSYLVRGHLLYQPQETNTPKHVLYLIPTFESASTKNTPQERPGLASFGWVSWSVLRHLLCWRQSALQQTRQLIGWQDQVSFSGLKWQQYSEKQNSNQA